MSEYRNVSSLRAWLDDEGGNTVQAEWVRESLNRCPVQGSTSRRRKWWATIPALAITSAAVGISAVGAITFGPDSHSMVSLVVSGILWLGLLIVHVNDPGARGRDEGR